MRPASPIRLGSVVSFDEHRGWGEVVDAADGSTHGFHCTVIDGGARSIEPGTAVAFLVGPGGPGRWEAVQVVALPSG